MSTPAFDITAPLPEVGTTLIEASAGTGKTWAIAALVTRYVAEGRAALDDLLVVTFGRAASAELRDRVRERLVEAEQALARRKAPASDPLLTLLLDADDAEVEERRRRLRRATGRFDEATITTTHGFCHAVLRSLGTMGDVEPGTTLVEDDGDTLDQVVADLYLRAVRRGTLPFGPGDAERLAREAVADPAARLVPLDAEKNSVADLRRRFAEAVRTESARRRLAARTMSYDDLLQRLADALEDEHAAARDVMRRRWSIVLVDEFQDTDPVQWQILERAFAGHATLVLVGDPKQSIYAFRGGDVTTYLAAARHATERRTLEVNHRSDAPLVSAIGTVLRGAALGDDDILVHDVSAAHPDGRLVDPASAAPFRLRMLRPSVFGLDDDRNVPIARARELVADDLAADIAGLLGRRATYDPGDGPRPVRAGDIAVIVERHLEADLVHAALTAHGVAAVRGGGSDVLRGEGGDAWVTLLTAMDAPHRSAVVRAAALGPFFGHDAVALAERGDRLTDEVAARLRRLVEVLRDRGVAGLVEALLADAALVERVLAVEGGRRRLTDLEHVGHVLQRAGRDQRLGLAGLLRWLVDRRADGAQAADRTRRLDSDVEAVQIVTTFVSKGLQYPVVYAPFLFDRNVWTDGTLRLHGPDGRRWLDVGGEDAEGRAARVATATAELAGESLRLLYVALTRAQSRLVVHWAPTWNGRNGALHRVLLRPDPSTPRVPDRLAVPSVDDAEQIFRRWESAGGPALEVMAVNPGAAVAPVTTPVTGLGVRELTREVDLAFTRTSYTSLVRVEEGPSVASEAPESGHDDEVEVTTESSASEPSPWADIVGGAALGTLVHGVLEDVDVTAPDLHAEVGEHIDHHLARRPLDVDPAALTGLVVDVLHSSLGPTAEDLTLADALALKPLREMDFELPLAGGDAGGRAAGVLGDAADLMDDLLAVDDPLRPFSSALRQDALRHRGLRGYLTGSIDLLMRTPTGRTLVADHKTNRLEPPDGGLDAYAPSRLADAMLHTTYPLQAMLYTVAQHRFLRWRMPGYDPDTHLGGVLYLFVRGMTGAETPTEDGAPYGVFAWRPPTALVLGLSDLLDGRGST